MSSQVRHQRRPKIKEKADSVGYSSETAFGGSDSSLQVDVEEWCLGSNNWDIFVFTWVRICFRTSLLEVSSRFNIIRSVFFILVWDNRRNFTDFRGGNASAEAACDERAANPGGEDGSEVELEKPLFNTAVHKRTPETRRTSIG